MKVRIAAVDPAFRNLGVARIEYVLDQNGAIFTPLDLHLAQTTDESGKRVRKSSDDLRRARDHRAKLLEIEDWADIIIAEIPSGSQSARASLGAGVMIGLLASLSKPLIEVSPAEAKRAAVGRTTATKDEMIEWAYGRWPDLNWIKHPSAKRPGKLTDNNEHLADALAIACAGINTPEFRAAAGMLGALAKAA